MNTIAKPFPCEELQTLIEKLTNQTNANEISETLALLLDDHIAHSASNRLELANTVALIGKLQQFFFNIEKTQTGKAAKTKMPFSEIEN
jgi:chorismate mutase